MDTSLVVAIVALLAAVFGPTVTSWFAMRQAAQERVAARELAESERKETRRSARNEYLNRRLDQLIEVRKTMSLVVKEERTTSNECRGAWGEATAIMLSIQNDGLRKLARSEHGDPIDFVDTGITKLGDMLNRHILEEQ